MSKRQLVAAALMLLPLAALAAPTAGASTGGSASVSHRAEHAGRVAQNGSPQRVAAAGPRRSDEPDSGLAVTLERISPAYLQPGEPIEVSGTITNLDPRRWRNLKAYLVSPDTAVTTTGDLADLAETPADWVDGSRIARIGLFEELRGLAPGASTPYELSIPWRSLGISSEAYGVYPLAVQVLATDPQGGRQTAGRARSLIPLMPSNQSPTVDVSTIWPFRADLVREPDGVYANQDELIEDVTDGRLRTLLDLARTSGADTPISLLIDPALLDALQRIVRDDAGIPRGPATPSESPTTEGADFGAFQAPTPEQQAAADFLDDLTALGAEHSVWAEGYGGPDLTALADYDSSRLYRTLTRANKATLPEFGLAGSPRAYAPTGILDVEALEAVPRRTTTFVTSDQVRRWTPADGPTGIVRAGGDRARVVVSDSSILEGGLEPGPTDTALQVRQRLLAETAVMSLEADADGRRGAPSVALLADDGWDPGPDAMSTDFFGAFDAPWVRATHLGAQVDDRPAGGARHLRVRDRGADRADQPIPNSLAFSADRIRGRGVIMYAITRKDDRLLTYYDQAAALTISEQWRAEPEASQTLANETIEDLDSQLAGVTIEAPEFVTLSSSSGQFPLTITNELTWPIRVGVRLDAEDGGLEIERDGPVEVDPQQSTTVNVRVEAEDVAVSEVTARLTTPKGRPFGEPVTFKMRSSVVGTVIWIALGAAGAVGILAVGRRIRRSTRSRGEAGAAESASSESG